MYSYIFAKAIAYKNTKQFVLHYGKFSRLDDGGRLSVPLDNESQTLYVEIVEMILALPSNPKRVLFTGESNSNKEKIREYFPSQLNNAELVTAGLDGDVDFNWDFEKEPPKIGAFSLIISQAMIEHLINPYKHLKDLSEYLEKDGRLIIHTEMPGFQYHRHPIDALRFYPDWFEEIAKPNRLNLQIEKKYIRDFHIFYMYKKN